MKKLINIIGRHGILDIFMDVSNTLEMTICVVNQLKNDSYCYGLYAHKPTGKIQYSVKTQRDRPGDS